MQYKIFVSYSTHDIEHVELLNQQLIGTSIEVFIAEHSVKPSEDLGEEISKAIEGCDLFVVLWSKSAQDSAWVSQEIGRAILDIYDGLILETQKISEDYLSIRALKLSSLGNNKKIINLSDALKEHYIKSQDI